MRIDEGQSPDFRGNFGDHGAEDTEAAVAEPQDIFRELGILKQAFSLCKKS